MSNFFACNSSNELAWKVLDTLYLLEENDEQNYVFVASKSDKAWSLLPSNEKIKVIDEGDLSELEPIESFYSLNNPYYNKTLISRIKPSSVYFNNKELSKKAVILSEEEIYYLKFLNTEVNLFTFQTILSTALKKELRVKEKSKIQSEDFNLIIKEFSSNDEVFFWRKLISLLGKNNSVTVFAPKELESVLFGYGNLENCRFKSITELDLKSNSQWIVTENEYQYLLNIHQQNFTVFYRDTFKTKNATHGPNAQYVASDLSINSFKNVQTYFKTGTQSYSWDERLETWTNASWARLEFSELVYLMYYLYWNYYLREKELTLLSFEYASSVNKQNITHYMQCLVEIHNLVTNLKALAEDKTEIDEFERILRHTNNSLIRVVNSDPLLGPIYTSFAVTNTASRNLSYEDIIRFYFKKSDDIQLLTTVIFELLNSFSNQNNFQINL